MRPGAAAFTSNQTGRCEPPDFSSAGDHFNPTNRQHGSLNPQGPHAGDLGNIQIGPGGGALQHMLSGLTLGAGETALLDADGAALVVHAQPDDLRTDPSGDSGARMACGVITRE
ncbi:MAG: superoxide dismutase family protein [Acidobacteria bacterium]|nr:superoxide dismutase family protein [Acidobacteriota bacterium]